MDYLPPVVVDPPALYSNAPAAPGYGQLLVRPLSLQPEAVPSATTAPFVRPTQGLLVRGFSPDNTGLNFAGDFGQPIVAAADGQVVYAGPFKSRALVVILRHQGGVLTSYLHASAVLVREGDLVRRGQFIAEMGQNAQGEVFLHFQVRDAQGKAVDPAPLLGEE